MKCFGGRAGETSDASSKRRRRERSLLCERLRDELPAEDDDDCRDRERRLCLLWRDALDHMLLATDGEREEPDEPEEERTLSGERLVLFGRRGVDWARPLRCRGDREAFRVSASSSFSSTRGWRVGEAGGVR